MTGQLALEHAAIRIVKGQRNFRNREIAADFGVHGDLLQAHRYVARRSYHQPRPLDSNGREILRGLWNSIAGEILRCLRLSSPGRWFWIDYRGQSNA